MSFKENFIRLCNEKGDAPTYVCAKIGLSNATFSCWTDESVPRKATLMRIADYFGVTVDYLVSGEERTEPALSDAEKRCVELLKKIPQQNQETALRILEALVQEQS